MSTLKAGAVLKRLTVKDIARIVGALIIIGAVSYAIHIFGNGWISIFYSTILALFPDKIKSLWNWMLELFPRKGQVRVTCTYYFRIMFANYFLLIDEHGEGLYRPVGGVYKYHREFDIHTAFEGTYDGILGAIDDTENDLRLKIGANKVKEFFKWFESCSERETIDDLTREFKEELIDTRILPPDLFVGKKLTYSYVGSLRESSVNSLLNIKQIQNYDIVSVQLSEAQEKAIKRLAKTTPGQDKPRYIFATEEEILQGYCNRSMEVLNISKRSKCILVSEMSSLDKIDKLKKTYTQTM